MKKILITLITLCLTSGACFCGKLTKADITRAVDGDTVKIKMAQGEYNVRLIGIDCFETSRINRAYKQAYGYKIPINEVLDKGEKATQILQNIVSKNKGNLYIDIQGIDHYGRFLGLLYNGKHDCINTFMKNTGYCPAYTFKK